VHWTEANMIPFNVSLHLSLNYFFVFAKYFKSDEFIRAFLFTNISLQNMPFVHGLVLSIVVEH
jgi:hypothetical protein